MKRTKLFIFILGVFFIKSQAQVLTLLDSKSQHPLELATLTSEHPLASAVTNSKGQTQLSSFEGAEKIVIRLLGYKPKTISYSEAEQQNFTISLEIAGVSLAEIVVSASRWNQPGNEVPVRVASISPSQVSFTNPQTTADLLSNSGEVFIQKSQMGGGSPMIRGFATNRVLIAVDGIRMNTAIFRSGNLQNIISIDPFSLESAEILFGPGSVIYGSDAIGGVMSFQTLVPEFSYTDEPLITGKTVARYSSANNEITGHFDIRSGWKKWVLVSGFTFSDFGDLRMGSNGPDEYLKPFYVKRVDSTDMVFVNEDQEVQVPTGYQQINMMQKLRFKPNQNWDFTYGFHYSTTSDYSRYDRLIRTKNGLPRSAEWYYGPQEWIMNNLTIVHQAGNKLYDRFALRTAWQFFKESRIDRDMYDTERRYRIEKVNAVSANLDFVKKINLKNKIFYGVEAVFNDINSTGTNEDITKGIKVTGPARYPKSTWESYAAYLNCQFRASDLILIQAGVRYNQFIINALFDTTFYPFPYTKTNVNSGALTGSLGMIYTPSANWNIYINLATGFRSPNIDDMGKVFDSEPGSVVVPNPGLKEEYAWNAEIGLSRVFGNFLKADMSAYYTLLDNAMVRRNYLFNGLDSIMYNGELSRVQSLRNAANAYIYGIQMGIELNIATGWGFNSRFNYQKGEEELDDGSKSPLRHAAPWFGSTHLTYTYKHLNMDWYVVYNGEISYENLAEEERGKDYMYAKDNDGNPYSPGWYTLNFKGRYQVNGQLKVSGGIENITDQRYRPYSSGIVAPGRNFVLSLQVLF